MRPGLMPAPIDPLSQSGSLPSPAAPHGHARLLSLLLVSALAPPTFLLVVILWAIWTRTPHAPFWDEWDLVPTVQHWSQGTLSLEDLWASHNEHRIFLPRILQLILILTTHWNRQIEMTFDLALSVVEATLLYLSLRKFIGSTILSVVSVLPLSLLLFSLSQYQNWLASFQKAFILTALGVAMCVYGLRQDAGRFGFAITLAGVVVAALSSLGGLVAFLAFLPAVFTQGYRKTAAWIVVATGIGIPYVIGFPHSVPVAITPDVVSYVLGHLGAPVGFPDAYLAGVLTASSVVLAVANLAVLLRHRRQIIAVLPWLGLALFAIGVAFITALGSLQVETAAGGVAASRYQVFSALWWVFILAIVLKNLADWIDGSLLTDTTSSRLARAGVIVTNSFVCCVLLLGLIVANVVGLAFVNSFQATQLQDEACVVNYAFASPLCLQLFHPQAQVVRQFAPYLQQEHLAIFSGDVAKLRVPPPSRLLTSSCAMPRCPRAPTPTPGPL